MDNNCMSTPMRTEIITALSEAKSIDEIGRAIVEKCSDVFDAEVCTLWRCYTDEHGTVEEVSEIRGERLKTAAKTLSVFVSRLLESQYGVQQKTYLPSYRVGGQRRVAVMFADIREFTPTTEICRNFDLVNELIDFIKRFSREISAVVQESDGRIHGLMGDAIMVSSVSTILILVKLPNVPFRQPRSCAGSLMKSKPSFSDAQDFRNSFGKNTSPWKCGWGSGSASGRSFSTTLGIQGVEFTGLWVTMLISPNGSNLKQAASILNLPTVEIECGHPYL
ncbi:MAG: hypothetical protein ACRERU_07530 [Methylococcales bacterium]